MMLLCGRWVLNPDTPKGDNRVSVSLVYPLQRSQQRIHLIARKQVDETLLVRVDQLARLCEHGASRLGQMKFLAPAVRLGRPALDQDDVSCRPGA